LTPRQWYKHASREPCNNSFAGVHKFQQDELGKYRNSFAGFPDRNRIPYALHHLLGLASPGGDDHAREPARRSFVVKNVGNIVPRAVTSLARNSTARRPSSLRSHPRRERLRRGLAVIHSAGDDRAATSTVCRSLRKPRICRNGSPRPHHRPRIDGPATTSISPIAPTASHAADGGRKTSYSRWRISIPIPPSLHSASSAGTLPPPRLFFELATAKLFAPTTSANPTIPAHRTQSYEEIRYLDLATDLSTRFTKKTGRALKQCFDCKIFQSAVTRNEGQWNENNAEVNSAVKEID